MAGLLPGEILDKNRLEIFQRRLQSLGYFHNTPDMGKPLEIKIVNKRPKDKPYGDLMMPLLGEGVTQARMQDPGANVELVPAPEPITAPNNVPRLDPGTGASAPNLVRLGQPVQSATGLDASAGRAAPRTSRPGTSRPAVGQACRRTSRGRWRTSRYVPQHARVEHDRRRARPERSLSQSLVRRHRDCR